MANVAAGRALGWASIGLGLTEIAAPRVLQQMMGLQNKEGILRVLGVREIMQGVDILSHRHPDAGVSARLMGDVIDLAFLGAAAKETRRPSGLAAAAAMVLGITVLDALCARSSSSHASSRS